MESQFGVSADKVIKKLSEVSKGTISNADLIESANKAMALGVTSDLDEMAQLMEVARVRGQAMGLDTTQAFQDIVTGIGRGSPLILDNLGIITKGWAEEAKAAGGAMDAQFILNKVLADGADILAKTGDVALTNAEKFQQMEATAKNLRLVVGQQLLPEIFKVTEEFANMGGGKGIEIVIRGVRSLIALTRFLALQFTSLARLFVILITPFTTFANTIIKGFDNIKKSFMAFLKPFKEFDGTVAGAKRAWASFKDAGSDTFTTLGDLGTNFKDALVNSIKAQVASGKKEYTDLIDSVKNIFGEIDTLIAENDIKQQERDALKVEQKTLLEQTLEDIEASKIKRLEALRKTALEKGIISEQEFTDLTLAEIEKRTKAREAAGKAISNIYTKSFGAATEALFDFNKSAKEKLKDVFKAIIDSISSELIARGTALIAASIFPPNPAGIGAGSGMIATGGAVKGIGNAALSRFRQGTDFSPSGTALVGEDGPELVTLPQGAGVTPNNVVNNESFDNRNITINVAANNGIELVNELKANYGVDVFG
jgi:hypothetical protein